IHIHYQEVGCISKTFVENAILRHLHIFAEIEILSRLRRGADIRVRLKLRAKRRHKIRIRHQLLERYLEHLGAAEDRYLKWPLYATLVDGVDSEAVAGSDIIGQLFGLFSCTNRAFDPSV